MRRLKKTEPGRRISNKQPEGGAWGEDRKLHSRCSEKGGSAAPKTQNLVLGDVFVVSFTLGSFLLRAEKWLISHPRFVCPLTAWERDEDHNYLKENTCAVAECPGGAAEQARLPGAVPRRGKSSSPQNFCEGARFLAPLPLPPRAHDFNPSSRMFTVRRGSFNFAMLLNRHIFRVWKFHNLFLTFFIQFNKYLLSIFY